MISAKKSIDNLCQGDIVYLNLNPTKGHEQRGVRPCIIVGKRIPFLKNMVSVAPITSKIKHFPLHVSLPVGLKVEGEILLEHHKMIDISARGFKFIESAPMSVVIECSEKIKLMY